MRWMDGIVTGLIVAIIVVALCRAAAQVGAAYGAALFMAGAALAFLSLPLALGTSQPPGGALALYRRLRHRSPPQPSAETTAAPERPRSWWDRALSPDNVWLIAGVELIGISFLPPFLGT